MVRLRIGVIVISAVLIALMSPLHAQTKPTEAEKAEWAKDRQPLESSPCKEVTWLLESERSASTHPIRNALGWVGRGFIEGAVYILGGEEVHKAAEDFGLSVDVVASHLSAYCYSHPSETPLAGIQDLLLKVVNTAK